MEQIIENFKLCFPLAAKDMVNYKYIGYECLEIKLENGDIVLYDDINSSLRKLPADSNNLSEEEYRREFGTRLRKIMAFKGVTQTDLSDRTGIPQTIISGYINFKHTPSSYIVDKIARALDCDINDFRYL